ncbi:hypothetical protein BS78_02G040800 [Paspalum vaginatum]|nr:hypothetical protein BS78_02G040800 [Paspalum vaginatum]
MDLVSDDAGAALSLYTTLSSRMPLVAEKPPRPPFGTLRPRSIDDREQREPRAMSKRGLVGLHGRRPEPLSLPGAATSLPRPAKRPRADEGGVGAAGSPAAYDGPVIVYEHTPRVVHVRADEFKALVQRLTGWPQQQRRSGDQEEAAVPLSPSAETTSEVTAAAGGGDPLVLTLGKQAPPPLPLFDDDDHTPAALLPSPGSLLSPGPFLFSPTTMQAIRELIS